MPIRLEKMVSASLTDSGNRPVKMSSTSEGETNYHRHNGVTTFEVWGEHCLLIGLSPAF